MRPPAGDGRERSGISGEPLGTNGARLMLAIGAVLILFTTTGNILTIWHDDPDLARWKPVLWEYSSAATAMVSLVIPWMAVRWAWPGVASWPRVLAVHGAGSVLFSVTHVTLFMLLRHAIYAALGDRYAADWNLSTYAYEFRKDVLGYALCIGVLWLLTRALARPAAGSSAPSPTAPTYDIRDGARLIRSPVGEILAARSAGNYVEFQLTGGGKPLARATLSAVEADLGPSGFVRTHRSWLVNAARVRGLTPEGSGDYAVLLDEGVTVPLSRRFPDALERLRQRAEP